MALARVFVAKELLAEALGFPVELEIIGIANDVDPRTGDFVLLVQHPKAPNVKRGAALPVLVPQMEVRTQRVVYVGKIEGLEE